MRAILRKTLVRDALLVAGIGAAAALTQFGCSSSGTEPGSPGSSSPAPGQGSSQPDGTGTVGLQLTIPGGELVSIVNWTITGPNGSTAVVKSGFTNVQNSQSVSFLVGGIPTGAGYTIALSATTTDGQTSCAGSATFSIAARATTNVTVALECQSVAADAGSAFVTATTFNCATANAVSASPAEAFVGSAIAVSGSASGPSATALSYAWSAPSGSFDTPNAPSANFTCAAPGPVTLTLTVGDGLVPAGASCGPTSSASVQVTCDGHVDAAAAFKTATKIKHVVVVFGENISFDHYFGTYPNAQNLPGETAFTAAPGTPVANNLVTPLDPTSGFAPVAGVNLLTSNPNLNAANKTGASNPFRLDPAQAETSDQGHNYMPEQQASDNGLMDLFPEFTGSAGPPPTLDSGAPAATQTKGAVMAYFDGNSTPFWGLAQGYALNDNSWTTVFGPSTPGAINLISGQTNGFAATNKTGTQTFSASHAIADGNGGLTMIGDTDPLGDVCSTSSDQNLMLGKNVGDLLNAQGITWGWFQGGFDLTVTNPNGSTGCSRSTQQTVPNSSLSGDYVPHHAPFQYYASTANPTHARPSSVAAIGTTDVANHEYDIHDFFDALKAGNLPAVSYLKAQSFQDGHPGNSNPVDEGNFVTQVVSALQASEEWSSTAIVFNYDDSDGWYDHQAPPIVNRSTSPSDALNGAGQCVSGAQQTGAAPTAMLLGAAPANGSSPVPVLGRCGYGSRIPLLVVSPFAKHNFIDHTLTDQTSSLRFIEDNWLAGERIQPGGSFDTIANSIVNMLSL